MIRQIMIAGTMLIPCSAPCADVKQPEVLESPYLNIIVQPGHLVVGTIPDGCAHVLDNEGKPAKTPPGFTLSPDQAMELAIKARWLNCASELFAVRYVLADTKNDSYSILSFWISDEKQHMLSAHVNGLSGEVKGRPVPLTGNHGKSD